jgi:hypothetical protein
MAAMDAQAETLQVVPIALASCWPAGSAWHSVQSLAGLEDGAIDHAMTDGLASTPPAIKVKTRKWMMSRFTSMNIGV